MYFVISKIVTYMFVYVFERITVEKRWQFAKKWNKKKKKENTKLLTFHTKDKSKTHLCPLQCSRLLYTIRKGNRKVQGVPQSQAAVHPKHEEEEETNQIKQAQIEQMHEKHQD